MAYFAKMQSNTVVDLIVINDNDTKNSDGDITESVGIAFCKNLFGSDTTWLLASKDGSVRKNGASKGMIYDSSLDAFRSTQPYASWTLNSDAEWVAPLTYPSDGNFYEWSESNYQANNSTGWVLINP